MSKQSNLTDAETLEQARVAFENVGNQPTITAALTEVGIDTAYIDEGKAIFVNTRQAYDLNKVEDDETSVAYQAFDAKRAEVDASYKKDRKKAKVVYRKDNVTADILGVSGQMPRSYVKWFEITDKFYTSALANRVIVGSLSRYGITEQSLTATKTKITELASLRSKYLAEVGESQAATQTKDQAMLELENWMSDFYAIAKIALEDKPQLLESIGKFVRN